MINNLRDYLEYLRKRHRLGVLSRKVSAELEIATITDRESRQHRSEGRSLLFDSVEGFDIPVATNLMASSSVLSDLFSGFNIAEFIGSMYHAKDVSMVKGARMLIDSKPKVSQGINRKYRRLSSLEELPILKSWPGDAGKFITLPLVITKSPRDGTNNVGIYRMQVFDGETTGMHWQSQKGGALHMLEARDENKALKVSVSIGTDPYNTIAAVAPLPHGINEFAFAGVARGARTDLSGHSEYPPAPSNSEIIIYGYVDPSESKMEGPFGDHTGYYSIPEPSSVFHVEEIYAKDNAVYAASVVGFPWSEDCVAGQFLMDYLRPLVKLINGNICDIFLPPEGAFTNMCLISVKKRFPGDAKKAMFSILGLGQLSLTKIIIAFDDDIDIRDLGRVMWALSTRIDPERDIQIIKGTSTDTLDHASNLSGYGSKMLIDATKKSAEEGYRRQWPGTIAPEPSILDEVERKWRQIK